MEVETQRDVSPNYLSLMDLLMEIWSEAYPALWNVRILIADVHSYVAKYAIEGTHRDRKVLDMIGMLRDLYKILESKISRDAVFNRLDMQRLIRCNVSRDLQERLVLGTMTEETYDELSNEYDSYVPRAATRSVVEASSSEGGERSATTQTDVGVAERGRKTRGRENDGVEMAEEEEEERGNATTTRDDDVVIVEERKVKRRKTTTTGLDGVFASMAGQAAEQAAGGLISQTVTKVENGRMFVIRTPGEIGDKVIRLSVYNAEDVRDKEKRDWWRYTKLRAQFLSSSLTSTVDRRSRVLHELFDVVTNHLTTVPGVVKEVRELFRSGDPDQEDRRRRRRSDEAQVEVVDKPAASRSDSVIANEFFINRKS